MFESLLPVIIGILIILIGYSNTKGNINSIHWYHRSRVAEEDRIPFGKLIGFGTMIIGAALILFSVLNFIAEIMQLPILTALGSIIIMIGIIAGILLNLYAMIRYNKGIF